MPTSRSSSLRSLMLVAWLTASSLAAEIRWTNAGDHSNWQDPANWSSNPLLPGPADDVIVESTGTSINVGVDVTVRSLDCRGTLYFAGTRTMSVAAASSIRSFSLGASILSGAGDLTLTGNAIMGNGALSGTGKLIIAPGANLSVPVLAQSLARPIEVGGTPNLTAGNGSHYMSLAPDDAIRIVRGGTLIFDLTGDSDATFSIWPSVSGQSFIRNAGTIVKRGPADLQFYGPSGRAALVLDNTGLVNCEGGSFSMLRAQLAQNGGSGTLTGGDWRTAGDGRISLPMTTRTIGAAASVTLAGSSRVMISGGIERIDGHLKLVNGQDFNGFSGAGTLVNNGVLELDPGTVFTLLRPYVQTAAGSVICRAAGLSGDLAIGHLAPNAGATLDGNVTVEFVQGWNAHPGESYPVLTSTSGYTGAFATATLPQDGLRKRLTYRDSSIDLVYQCMSDFNEDGGVDGADVEAFFSAWSQGSNDADVNQDGGVDGPDVEFFFIAWEAGSC